MVAAFLFCSSALGDDEPQAPGAEDTAVETEMSLTDKVKQIGDVDPAQYGIRNGCVSLSRIRSINFIDDQTAIVSMRGRKKILLRLRRECHGIEYNGFVHQTRGQDLCARFDSLRVMRTGTQCQIESLEPYIEVEDPPKEKQ